jgi:hypothetical protein
MDWVFLCEAHDVESNLSRLGETRAGEEGRDDLVMTTAGAKEIAAWSLRVGLHPNPRVLAELGPCCAGCGSPARMNWPTGSNATLNFATTSRSCRDGLTASAANRSPSPPDSIRQFANNVLGWSAMLRSTIVQHDRPTAGARRIAENLMHIPCVGLGSPAVAWPAVIAVQSLLI